MISIAWGSEKLNRLRFTDMGYLMYRMCFYFTDCRTFGAILNL